MLALFANGRIEEWLDCITMTPEDMCNPQYVPRIASHLHKFHQLHLDVPCKAPNTPWRVIDNWLQQAKQLTFSDPQKQVCSYLGYLSISGVAGSVSTALQACMQIDAQQSVCIALHGTPTFTSL